MDRDLAAGRLPLLRVAGRQWYNPSRSGSDPAQEAYDDAVQFFSDNLTADECKRVWIRDKTGVQHVQRIVQEAKAKYESRSQQSKAWKWLTKFSDRVIHYSKIMDTLANHHPEYVALAWGSMKFILMAVINHEELITQICKALSQIAIVLPRVNFKILMYPNDEIRLAVSKLYAHVLKFMQRAIKWYSEGRLQHVISAIFRPHPLRFQDLVEEIESCSLNVDQLAVSASQVEQRDMHILLLEMKRTITEYILENQAINSRLLLDSRRRTCEIQFSQILTFTATTSLPSPEESFQHAIFLAKRRRYRQLSDRFPPWRSTKLQDWAMAKTSSLILIKGSHLVRNEAKDFASDIVALLRSMKVSVVWTLSARADGNLGWRFPVDVLKQLVMQVLCINQALLKEQSSTLNAARFQSASTESDWFDLLALALRGSSQIFIVVDGEVLSREFASELHWPEAFLKLFEDLKISSPSTRVKVVLLSLGSSPYSAGHQTESLERVTVKIEGGRGVRHSGGRRVGFIPSIRRQASEDLRPFLIKSMEAVDS